MSEKVSLEVILPVAAAVFNQLPAEIRTKAIRSNSSAEYLERAADNFTDFALIIHKKLNPVE